MLKTKIKRKLISCTLLLLMVVSLAGLSIKNHYLRINNTGQIQSDLDYSMILGSEESWGVGCCGKVSGYEEDYAKIKSISFAKKNNELYIRHELKGTMPKKDSLPEIGSGDKLTHLIYRIAIDKNYTDREGNINPGGFDIQMKISFYGDAITDEGSGISVSGALVEGGEGYDYFITKYPYDQLFFDQIDNIVFSADALVVTDNYPGGATAFIFNSKENAADSSGEKINLSLK